MKSFWSALAALVVLVTLVGCNDPPRVTGITPSSGPLGGGTSVTVTGSNFDTKSRVAIAGILCSNISYQGSGSLVATSPAGPFVGSWDVEVINHDGQRDKLRAAFTYSTGVTNPTITTVSPTSGSAGASVTITGTNFQSGCTVNFGSTAATGVSESNGTTIICTAPTGPAGAVSVTVNNPDGGSASLASGFTYPGTSGGGTTTGGATITAFAGAAASGFGGDGGAATSAQLSGPMGLAVAPDASVYIADTGNNRIRQVGANGIIQTVAGGASAGFADGAATTTAQLRGPRGLAVDSGGTLYIADTGNHAIRTLSGGQIATLAGTGTSGNTGDGATAKAALCNAPAGVSVDGQKNVIFADTGNNRCRRIDATAKTIANFAGSSTGQAGFSGDGGVSSSALLSGPEGVIVDVATATVFISDTGNNRIRKVDSSNNITTYAGSGSSGYSGDGGPASAAQMTGPTGLGLDASNNLYICDTQNNHVRIVNAGNLTIANFAGNGQNGSSGNGAAATAAALSAPFGVTVSTGSAIVYIGESGSGAVRQVH